MANSSESDRFEFGSFLLDRRRRLLTDADGSSANINAKAFDTLVYFLEHPGQVVSRSTLLEALWPDTVVEENNLSQAVAALRRALGDGFIVTVPRRGYQFVAEVRMVGEKAESSSGARDPAGPISEDGEETEGADPASTPRAGAIGQRPAGASRRQGNSELRTAYLVAAAVTATVVGGALVVANYSSERASPENVNVSTSGGPVGTIRAGDSDLQLAPKVAVLPCENLSPNPDDAYFAAGIHEEILNQLTKLSGVRVVARTSVVQYEGNRPPIPQIARELDAAAVLECSVRYAGTGILVTAQLIDPQSEAHLWSNTYPGDLSNLEGVFAMQADIAVKIANALDAALSPDEERRLDVLPTKSPQAYVAFLRDLDKRDIDDFSNLDRAIEIDPNFGLAYAVRGLKHAGRAMRATLSPESSDPIEEIRLAIADADRALAIDPDLGLAHIVSGARYLGPKRDRERMRECFERALALSPNDAWVLHLASTWYLAESLPREAHELLVRIEQLDPINSAGSEPTRRIGEFFFLSGDLERSTQYLRRRVQQQPTSALWRHLLAFNEALLGNREEAIRQLDIAEELLADSPEDEVYRVGYAPVYAYSRIGRPADARRMFDRFLAAADDGDLLPMMWVMAYLGIGDVERAYEWAKVVVDRTRVPWPGPHLWLALNPMSDPVLERPEFLELRRKLGYRN